MQGKKLYIRPVWSRVDWVGDDGYPSESEVLLSIALCTTNRSIEIDEQILIHFPADITGLEIKEDYPTAEWGNTIYSP